MEGVISSPQQLRTHAAEHQQTGVERERETVKVDSLKTLLRIWAITKLLPCRHNNALSGFWHKLVTVHTSKSPPTVGFMGVFKGTPLS